VNVRVRLFAAAREQLGQEVVSVELPEPANVGDLRRQLAAQYPALQTWVPHLLFAADLQYVTDDQCLDPTAELAAFPPVSGG
jgi:molybdopterin converting factor small subunit